MICLTPPLGGNMKEKVASFAIPMADPKKNLLFRKKLHALKKLQQRNNSFRNVNNWDTSAVFTSGIDNGLAEEKVIYPLLVA